MRVLFWGTADFALPTLRRLVGSHHRVAGVVTQPDRPAGRGRQLRATPVKEASLSEGLEVIQPEKPRGEAFLERIGSLEPELSVVAAYGEILTEDVLELPPRGSINVHASLLPELRGAAPVNWAIIRGHRETGVSIMRMVRELDAGPVLRQEAVELDPRARAGELFEELAELGGELLLQTLEEMEAGEVEGRPQDDARATYAPKLDRETARLDWSLQADELDRWIRGCDPWPASWSQLRRGDETTRVQLFAPRPVDDAGSEVAAPAERGDEARSGAAGEVLVADSRQGVRVAAGRGSLWIDEVRPAGRSRMESAEWVRGRGVSAGDRFL